MTAEEATERGARPADPLKPSFCMINYNGAEFLSETLPAAIAQAHLFEELLFVDNGSTDGSADLVEREFPAIRVVRLSENGGPGAARNAGFREARSDLILFLDNDVSLTQGCLEQLSAALAKDAKAAVAMPAVLYAHRRDIVQYAGAGSHFLGLMTLHEQDRPVREVDPTARPVTSVVTCCFLVDRARIGEHEPFDEAYFYQMEDHDFGVRLRSRGFTILAVPSAQVFHGKGTEGMSIRQLGGYAPIRVYCLIRNRWIFLLKHYSTKALVILAPVLLFYELLQLGIVIKKGWLREWRQAAGWIFGNWSALMAKRRSVQQLRRLSDRELFIDGPVPFRNEISASALERTGKRLLDVVSGAYWKAAAQLL